jgi:hypothetical protein
MVTIEESGVRKRKTLNSQCIKQIGICEKDKYTPLCVEDQGIPAAASLLAHPWSGILRTFISTRSSGAGRDTRVSFLAVCLRFQTYLRTGHQTVARQSQSLTPPLRQLCTGRPETASANLTPSAPRHQNHKTPSATPWEDPNYHPTHGDPVPAPEEPFPAREKPILRDEPELKNIPRAGQRGPVNPEDAFMPGRPPPGMPSQGAQHVPRLRRQTTGVPQERPEKTPGRQKALRYHRFPAPPGTKRDPPNYKQNLYPAPVNGTRKTAERRYA